MLSYFYKLTPLVIIGAICILSLPWLGLIALMIVALVVLPALAGAILFVPYMLARAISRRWHGDGGAGRPAAVALSATTRQLALRRGHAS